MVRDGTRDFPKAVTKGTICAYQVRIQYRTLANQCGLLPLVLRTHHMIINLGERIRRLAPVVAEEHFVEFRVHLFQALLGVCVRLI